MKRIIHTIILVSLVICKPVALNLPPVVPAKPMRVHYINVGQGDAILLEFPKAAVLIDAGGEITDALDSGEHLLSYLRQFFKRRADLKLTIDTIIITHPHLDHTRLLPKIVDEFRVKNLIDGGETSGSGIAPLVQARRSLSKNGGRYFAAKDSKGRSSSLAVPAFNALRILDPNVALKLLSGSRDCEQANNNSLVVLVDYRKMRFLFTGDAEAQADDKCRDEISMLIGRYKEVGLLKADVLKVNYHGSAQGTTDEWMQAIQPQISIITAGQSGEAHRGPGSFHSWQFGHPRESAVRIINDWTSGSRPAKKVITMQASRQENKPEIMEKAVYCTCWDGDIVVTANGSTLRVETSDDLGEAVFP